MKRCTYLLPIRRRTFSEADAQELAVYFQRLNLSGCEVVVLDRSPPEIFQRNAAAWTGTCDHQADFEAGVGIASSEKILLAEDDIRYASADIEKMCALLDVYDLVRPQNFIAPLPWWARIESARLLINRATLRNGDFPGTYGFRRSTMLRVGCDESELFFDCREMERRFSAASAAISYAVDFFIQRKPPRLRRWLKQCARHAFDDFAVRPKTVSFLALPFFVLASGVLAGVIGLLLSAAALSIFAIALACAGGARGVASDYIPPATCLYAPLWICEQVITSYWALYCFAARGGERAGGKVLTASNVTTEAAAQKYDES